MATKEEQYLVEVPFRGVWLFSVWAHSRSDACAKVGHRKVEGVEEPNDRNVVEMGSKISFIGAARIAQREL